MECLAITKEEAKKMIDNLKDNKIQIQIICNGKESGRVPLKYVEVGETICNGKYVVVEHFEDGTSGIVKKEAITPGVRFGETNKWFASDLFTYLNRDYLKEIDKDFDIQNVVTHTVDMLSMDGDNTYGVCRCVVSAMTFDRWRKYHKYIGEADCTEWLSTPNQTEKANDTRYVQVVGSSGGVDCGVCCWDGCGVRPFFILKSSILVSIDKT